MKTTHKSKHWNLVRRPKVGIHTEASSEENFPSCGKAMRWIYDNVMLLFYYNLHFKKSKSLEWTKRWQLFCHIKPSGAFSYLIWTDFLLFTLSTVVTNINTTFLSCILQSLPKTSNTASYEWHKSFELWCSLTSDKHLIPTIRELFTFYSWTAEEMLISFNSRVLCNITKPIWFSSCSQLSKIILICILWSLQSDWTSWDFTCYLFFVVLSSPSVSGILEFIT